MMSYDVSVHTTSLNVEYPPAVLTCRMRRKAFMAKSWHVFPLQGLNVEFVPVITYEHFVFPLQIGICRYSLLTVSPDRL